MMLEMEMTRFLEALSSAEPVPGGGGAAAAAGAMGAALGMMVANLTVGKKTYADVEAEVLDVRERLLLLKEKLVALTDEDAQVFAPLAKAYRLPKDTEEQIAAKEIIMEQALYEASMVPMKIMETMLEVMQHLEVLGAKGSKMAVSDVGVGILFSQAALEGASLNVFINTKLMKNREKADKLNEKASYLITEGNGLKEKVYTDVLGKLQ